MLQKLQPLAPPLCERGHDQVRNPISDSAPNPEAVSAAKSANLRYVSDHQAGIARVRLRGHFSYRDAAGKEIKDLKVLARIKALAVPPAWTNEWICASTEGHIIPLAGFSMNSTRSTPTRATTLRSFRGRRYGQPDPPEAESLSFCGR